MSRAVPVLSGHSGPLSGQELLSALELLGCSGTLLLEDLEDSEEDGEKVTLLLLHQGEVRFSHPLGGVELTQTNLGYHFHPHPEAALPELPGRYPSSSFGVPRALPELGRGSQLEADVVELPALLARLTRGFSGTLSLSSASQLGLMLFWRGQLAAAFWEGGASRAGREGRREGNSALRAIYRQSLGEETAELEVCRLESQLAASLLGLALGFIAQDEANFSGLEAGEAGYTYYQHGQAYLHVAAELRGESGRYALAQHAPGLKLPTEPPGWEAQRYQLTLRGRDALNPMAELAIAFRREFGTPGRRILDQLASGATVEEAAARLGLELTDFKEWLTRLEAEGLIQLAPQPYPFGQH
jgi:hypothetical protein